MKLLLISAGNKIIKIIKRQSLVEKCLQTLIFQSLKNANYLCALASSLDKCPIRARPSLERGYETDTWPAKMHSVLYTTR